MEENVKVMVRLRPLSEVEIAACGRVVAHQIPGKDEGGTKYSISLLNKRCIDLDTWRHCLEHAAIWTLQRQ